MKFIRWDNVKRIATEYERTGQCNGCGDCCAVVICFDTVSPLDSVDSRNGGKTMRNYGVWNEVSDEAGKRFYGDVKVGAVRTGYACPLLTLENRCAKNADKHQMSKDYPFDPRQVDGELWRCSFRFKEIGQWSYAELGVKVETYAPANELYTKSSEELLSTKTLVGQGEQVMTR